MRVHLPARLPLPLAHGCCLNELVWRMRICAFVHLRASPNSLSLGATVCPLLPLTLLFLTFLVQLSALTLQASAIQLTCVRAHART